MLVVCDPPDLLLAPRNWAPKPPFPPGKALRRPAHTKAVWVPAAHTNSAGPSKRRVPTRRNIESSGMPVAEQMASSTSTVVTPRHVSPSLRHRTPHCGNPDTTTLTGFIMFGSAEVHNKDRLFV